MKKLNCIIVDDEPLALDILEDYIRLTPSLELEGRFTSGADALGLLHALGGDGGRGIDLAFIDIQMPGIGGLDLARLVGEVPETRVVFTTAFPQYALEGFRVDALDYLLKPISFEEFTRAVGRAAEWFGRDLSSQSPEPPQTLIVKSDYKQFVILLRSIVYIEGIRDYIGIHFVDAAGRPMSVQTLMNMKTIEAMLPKEDFARVHRSYIVALDRIERLERSHVVIESGDTLSGMLSIPVSDTYKASFMRALAARAL